MIDLWYFNTKNITHEELDALLLRSSLPPKIKNDVLRYKYHKDRCHNLFGKLLVRKYIEGTGIKFNWDNWSVSSKGKPFYTGDIKFNISHSEGYVVVGFSHSEVGVDIENIGDFELDSMSNYLHPLEQKFIKDAANNKDAFFTIWTRKEAFLKAVERGIIDGLHNESCLSDKIVSDGIWFLHSFSFIADYKVAICTEIENCSIKFQKLSLKNFR